MGFETFIPRKMVIGKPMVTILPVGVFWVNPATTTKYFKGFKRTFLLYDRERRVVGLKPTNEEKHTLSVSRSKARNSTTVAGKGFLEYFKILPKERKSYEATWNSKEKVVEVDLNNPL